MPKKILYECDKCRKIEDQGELPSDWATAIASVGFNIGPYGAEKFERIWCAECWAEINTKVLKKATS
jgi:hypothetical protein